MDVVSSLGTLLSYVDIIAREVAQRQSSSKQFPIVLEQLKLSLVALNELVADVVLSPQTQRLIDYLIEGLQSGVDEVRNQQDSNRTPVILSRWFNSPQLVESCESMIQQIEDIKVKMEKVKSTQVPSDYLYEYPEVRAIWKVSFNDANQVPLDTGADGSSGLIDDLHSHIQLAIRGKEYIQLWHRKGSAFSAEGVASSSGSSCGSEKAGHEGEGCISSVAELLTKDMLECLLRPHCRRRDLTVKSVSSPGGAASPQSFRFGNRISSPTSKVASATVTSNTDFIFDPFQLNRWLNTIRASWVREQGGEWQLWEGRSQTKVVITPMSLH